MIVAIMALAFNASGYERVRAEGAAVQGQVKSVNTDLTTTVYNQHPMRITYEYDLDGQRMIDEMSTMDPVVGEWEPGHQVELRVLGSDSVLVGVRPVIAPRLIWVVIALWTLPPLGGLALLVPVYGGVRKKTLLYTRGHLRQARIVAMAPTGTWPVGPFCRARFLIHYRFTDSVGLVVSGSSLIQDLEIINDKRRGDELNILCLENKPSVSCVAEDAILRESNISSTQPGAGSDC